MLTTTVDVLHSPSPWSVEFDSCGGYDGMTGVWDIYDANNRLVATVDQRHYGQPNCDYEFRSPLAEANAKLIAHMPDMLVEIHCQRLMAREP